MNYNNEDSEFFELGICDSCEEEDLVGCWDGVWLCEDCYIENIELED